VGRRERTKERRLLKGFNIGLVEGVNFEVVSDRSSSNALAKIIMKVLVSLSPSLCFEFGSSFVLNVSQFYAEWLNVHTQK
jgi:hypothetical protein